MSDVSSLQAARDAGGATHWTGAAARHGPPLASDGPRWHRLRSGSGLGRLGQSLSGCASVISPGNGRGHLLALLTHQMDKVELRSHTKPPQTD